VTIRGAFEYGSDKLEEPQTILGVQARSLWAPQIAVEHCGQNNIFSGDAAGVPGDYRYYLSFNDYQNSCIQFVLSSMYLSDYVSI